MSPVNPEEGQVAIPYATSPNGYVVGRLGARAMRWAEQELGRTIDDVWTGFIATVRDHHAAAEARTIPTTAGTLPVSAASTVIWAAIEHERRLAKAPGPEYTIDDADAIVDEVGVDRASSYALALIQLSMPFRKRTEALRDAAVAAGAADPVGPLMAAAMEAAGGTGTPTSTPPSTPASTSPPPGT